MHNFKVGNRIQLNEKIAGIVHHYCNPIAEVMHPELIIRGTIVGVTHRISTYNGSPCDDVEVKWDSCRFSTAVCDAYPMDGVGTPWIIPIPDMYSVVLNEQAEIIVN